MENNLAVLIDFENIAAGTEKEGLGRFDVEALMTRIKDKGRVLVARSYADWGRFSRFKQTLLTANITMMELTSHGMQDKNRADIALVVDALELAYTRPYLDTFVVVSGDSDFTPMVLKMRELNKRVIGVGTRGSTSRLLIQACDEFLYYDSVLSRPEPKRGDEPMTQKMAYGLLVDAVDGLLREDAETPLASVVKTAMLRKSPDFSETDLGFGSFARFLESAQEKGYVKVSRDPKSGGYRVDATEAAPRRAGGGERPAAAAREEAPAQAETRVTWEDPYLPAGTEAWVNVLAGADIHPLAAPTRMAILDQLESLSAERRGKRRKITLIAARDEIKKRLRRTHPDLPSEAVRGVLNALLLAGLLIHRDGSAIRSASAPFEVSKTAAQLNEGLLNFYLAHLRAEGADLSDPSRLADLFLGDASRRREVEEALAWLATAPAGEDEVADLNAVDLDDLLVFDDGAARETTLEEEEQEKTVPSIPAVDVEALPADLDDLLSVDGKEEAAPEVEAQSTEKPKTTKKRRRAPRKKGEELPAGDDLDALLD